MDHIEDITNKIINMFEEYNINVVLKNSVSFSTKISISKMEVTDKTNKRGDNRSMIHI